MQMRQGWGRFNAEVRRGYWTFNDSAAWSTHDARRRNASSSINISGSSATSWSGSSEHLAG